MSLDFNEFLNIGQHYKKIEHGAQEIREKYAPRPAATKQYVHNLFDFFLSDIRNTANDIYEEILHKKDRLGYTLKFTPADLRGCIEGGTYSLLTTYNRIISSVSMGGMFRDFDNADKEKTLFNREAEALCKKQGEIFETKYIKLLEKYRRENLTYVGAVLGGITGAIALMGTAVALIPEKAVTVVIKGSQYIFSMFHR
jgi:hypothetical protein